jgi:hypothetical protein
MDRNWLTGIAGDAMHAILCAAGHNPHLLLRANATSLRLYLLVDLEWFKPLELFPPDQCAATMLRPSDDAFDDCPNRKTRFFRSDFLTTSMRKPKSRKRRCQRFGYGDGWRPCRHAPKNRAATKPASWIRAWSDVPATSQVDRRAEQLD